MSKNQWVVKDGKNWAVKGEGNNRATSVHPTQKAAIDAAKPIAQNHKGELIIQGNDGRIRDRMSYGNDPCPPKDKR